MGANTKKVCGVINHRRTQRATDVSCTNFRRVFTSENLTEDFGRLSETGRAFIQELSNALADALGQPGSRKIKMLFEEWETLYGQVSSLGVQRCKRVSESLGFDFPCPIPVELPAKLFVIHTFHSLLMKMIAAEVVAAHGMAPGTSLAHKLLSLESDEALIETLRLGVESGGFFNTVGLRGFVEENIFSWYLDAATKKAICTSMCSVIRALLILLSAYRFNTIKKTGRSRDVLRDFYQDLVPEELRRSLGEFYTPDWLVEHAVSKLDYRQDKWLAARFLDPTCGSGSFLLEVIEQKRRAALAEGWTAEQTVDMLTTTVWGFDLNPLAVQSARVNFLIAIADLLVQCKGKDIEIPVFLVDAVCPSAARPDVLSPPVGQFDAIVGNPPWVRWSNLPEAYRNQIKPTCEKYAIFSDAKFHGGSELDISAIITYTTADKWLVEDGRLVFVITQTLFQSPSAQGFRRFRINAIDRLVPISVDDMKEIKPFPDAANKTAVAMFTKKREDTTRYYPVDYQVWLGKPKTDDAGNSKKGRGGQVVRLKAISPRLHREEVANLVDVIQMEANPVSQTMEGAPWAIMKPGCFAACQLMFGPSTWVNGRKGITTDLNGVYFVDVVDSNPETKTVKVRTRPHEGKTDLGQPREFWVEAESLFPLAKGAGDLHLCYFLPKNTLYAFVPNKGIDRASLDSAKARYNSRTNPKTFQFFKAYKSFLESRSTFRARMKGAPFFAIYNVGDYTFAPYKVIWAEMTGDFSAAVVESGAVPGYGPRVYVPDHKLYFAGFDQPEPAFYLCGLLHSEIVKEMIEAHNVATNMGDIFKHVSLPEYDADSEEQKALALLVKQAHQEDDSKKRANIVAKIRVDAAKIIEAEIERRRH